MIHKLVCQSALIKDGSIRLIGANYHMSFASSALKVAVSAALALIVNGSSIRAMAAGGTTQATAGVTVEAAGHAAPALPAWPSCNRHCWGSPLYVCPVRLSCWLRPILTTIPATMTLEI